MRRLLPLPALLALSPLAAALPQGPAPEAWIHQVPYVQAPYLDPLELHPTPDGGVLSVIHAWNSPSANQGTLFLIALDANGDRKWTWTRPIAADGWDFGPDGPFAAAAVDDAGRVYVARSRAADSELVALDADGTEVWAHALTSPVDHPKYHATCIALTADGHPRVGGAAYPSVLDYPVVSVHAFDPSGAVEWEWSGEFAPDFRRQAIPFGLLVGEAGRLHLHGQSDYLEILQPDWTGVCHTLASDGTFLWTFGGGSSQRSTFSHGKVDSNGDVVLVLTGMQTGFFGGAEIFRVARVDSASGAGGSTGIPTGSTGVPRAARDLALTSTGVALVAPDFGGARLIRVDRSGAVLPELSIPAPGVVQAVAARPNGDVLVSVGGTYDARFDAADNLLWSKTWPGIEPTGLSIPQPGGVDLDIVFDPRGNAFRSNFAPHPSLPGRRVGIVKYADGGSVGTNYCGPAVPNSTGASGHLDAIGSDARAVDNVTLRATGLPGGSFALLITSPDQGFAAQPGGSQGNLCLGGQIGRYVAPGEIRRALSNGTTSLQIDLDEMPRPVGDVTAAVGETWNFQMWYRDAIGGTATANFTDGLSLVIR